MRDKNTSVKDFRALVGEIAMLLTYEATRALPMTTRTIETPILSLIHISSSGIRASRMSRVCGSPPPSPS